ncbi:hypothetical protein [Pseudooceanicola spongiae]|uniref:Uncharacterized protein n=1 Tax=Pseudooceanicola spongiae TaxID=2613965 RepID=A0A7L9WJ92_9RHOB|nr:hypothetical protein [Pseudooceanicola spongiae]QOL80032.1 hypothetical protein F3W81_03845 [Pseudooceanicola spongiae]
MSSETYSPPDIFDPPEENSLYPELFRLHREIHEFSQNLDDFPRLLEIQRRLITAISEAERKIRGAKKASSDPRGWQYVRYNFLCLGDCLAFLYMDRFALKQTFFDVDTVNPKQSGGFITDKAGHANEVSLLEDAISHNVPAVLCDITNVLRYGDICLLGDSDPVPIEIKSSKTKDRRGKRQNSKLKTLYSFLASDRSDDFRGLPGTTFRTEFSVAPKSYSNQLQVAIVRANLNGSSSFEVDGCLKVVVIMEDPDYEALFGGFDSPRVLVNSVNQIKTNKLWGCYYPYPLTLSEPSHYEGFVRGEIHIFTLLDVEAFEEKLALEEGTSLSVDLDENDIQCQIHFSNLFADEQEAYFIIGEHMMCRMWTDFLCPSWIVQSSISSVVSNVEAIREAADSS